jgi:hypothetical protein
MKNLLFSLLLFPLFALAQNVDVKDVNTSGESTTTIEIRKGQKPEEAKKVAPTREVHDATADLEGEGALESDAKKDWKNKCGDWKKELKDANKEDKDNFNFAMNCGIANCSGDAGKKTCTSKATYKIKSKID